MRWIDLYSTKLRPPAYGLVVRVIEEELWYDDFTVWHVLWLTQCRTFQHEAADVEAALVALWGEGRLDHTILRNDEHRWWPSLTWGPTLWRTLKPGRR